MMSLARRTSESFELLAVTPPSVGIGKPASVGAGKIEVLSTAEISAPVVDNERGTYLLQVVITGPDVCLRGVQISYRAP